MILSMTAFGQASCETDAGVLIWEVRSVNHRYLEVGLRLPEELRAIETEVRQAVGGKLKRGKVDCQLRWQASDSGLDMQLDLSRVDRLVDLSNQVARHIHSDQSLRVADIMRWPGVLAMPELDTSKLGQAAIALLGDALDQLVATRQREGARIREMLQQRLDGSAAVAREIQALMPEIRQHYRQRVEEKLQEFQEKLDPQRLEQEIVLFAQKADVDEELDRLLAHIDEVGNVLNKGGPVGRRLDFLMQELNREANTLGSKAVDLRMTNASVELKVFIEQMREQIQNLE
jgi:uncharacterized protein (TIGR00255 family)